MTSLWRHAETLDESESLRLLASARLGRLGMSTPDGPQVLPVNYTVIDGTIVLRTGLYTTIAHYTDGQPVALEVDEFDDRMRSGWSVQVMGQARHVADHAETEDLFARMVEPWAPSSRPLLVRIDPVRVTGRRFHSRD
jgi:nitroimidazol reductase NimA-like FMN-containing flavoprotein (pyridoxamine 5'-phosphate oxidase superfamily)